MDFSLKKNLVKRNTWIRMGTRNVTMSSASRGQSWYSPPPPPPPRLPQNRQIECNIQTLLSFEPYLFPTHHVGYWAAQHGPVGPYLLHCEVCGKHTKSTWGIETLMKEDHPKRLKPPLNNFPYGEATQRPFVAHRNMKDDVTVCNKLTLLIPNEV